MNVVIAVHMREWQRLVPGKGAGAPLANLRLAGAAERALVDRLAAQRMLHVRELAAGMEIEATSFVGKVRLGDVSITIAPKLHGGAILRLFCYAYEVRDLLGDTTFAEGGSLFQDLLLAQLFATAREIVARGLHRRYLGVNEELASPRGRLDLNRLAVRSPSAQGTLPCRHHLRLEDCLVNQVLLAGLRLGASVVTDRSRAAALQGVAEYLAPTVREVSLTGRLLVRAQQGLDRLTEAYAPALKLIELLLDSVSPALDEGTESLVLPGFLFDMNRLFQRLVGRFLRENLVGCKVEEEQSLKEMMRYAPRENPRVRPAPRPRPDFAVTTENGMRTLLDAKYRDLWVHDLPRDMLYQLAMYALSQPAGGKATIVYPTTVKGASPARIQLRDAVHDWERASVVLQPIDLEELDAVIAAGVGRSAREARTALARQIAIGTA